MARRMPISRVLSATTIVRVPDDVERGHHHDEEDNQSHAELLELEGLNRLAFWVCQSSVR